jgi:hypothetical protein
MKKLILIFWTLVCAVLALTQDYQCVKADAEYMFWDGYEYHAIAIDSVIANQDYQSYYNFPTIGGEDENLDCLSKNWASWIGRKIDIYPNGDHLFYNYLVEPVLIKTQSEPGSSWTCYTFSDNRYVECIVYAKEEMSFLGVSDTVKKAAFQVRDQNGDPLTHQLNTKELWISRNHGLVKALNFKLFPDLSDFMDGEILDNDLCGISSTGTGIQNLTLDQIFNFEVGDEFHIMQYTQMIGYLYEYKAIMTVLNKYWLNDSILFFVYKRCARQHFYDHLSGDTTYYLNDTVNEFIPITNPENSGLNLLPERYLAIGDSNYYEYQWFAQSNNEEYGKLQKSLNDGFVSHFPHECIEVIITKDKYYEGETYLEGLGGPYYHYGEWGDEFYRGLVYYKKGNEEWGDPYNCDSLLSGVNEPVSTGSKVILFPNPMHSTSKLIMPGKQDGNYQLQLYNSMGLIAKELRFQSNEIIIQKSDLDEGIYFYRVNSENQVIADGKLVVQ